ncbi:MAG: hypothetical protein ACRDBP_18690 [Luteolibacter sp.]
MAGYHRLGAIEAFLLGSEDVHGAVVLDIDLGTGLGLDALDVLAARSDEFADAIPWNLDENNAWGMWAERLRLKDGLGYFLKDDRNAFDIQDSPISPLGKISMARSQIGKYSLKYGHQ